MSKCDRCDKPAILHETRVVNGKTRSVHLCEEHAAEAGFQVSAGSIAFSIPVPGGKPPGSAGRSCSDCGMTISDFKETSLLGCPACYETFESHLEQLIVRVQGGQSQHVGKAPRQVGGDVDRQLAIKRLLKELDSAVGREQYERAAEIRDELRHLHDGDEQ